MTQPSLCPGKKTSCQSGKVWKVSGSPARGIAWILLLRFRTLKGVLNTKDHLMELIKLKTTPASRSASTERIESTFLDACIHLDAARFEPLIDEDDVFQDLDKYRFLAMLQDLFEEVRAKGVERMTALPSMCEGCHLGHAVTAFYGHELIPEFSFIILKEDGLITDIFQCNLSHARTTVEMAVLQKHDFWRW